MEGGANGGKGSTSAVERQPTRVFDSEQISQRSHAVVRVPKHDLEAAREVFDTFSFRQRESLSGKPVECIHELGYTVASSQETLSVERGVSLPWCCESNASPDVFVFFPRRRATSRVRGS